jgi:hypothetical protein
MPWNEVREKGFTTACSHLGFRHTKFVPSRALIGWVVGLGLVGVLSSDWLGFGCSPVTHLAKFGVLPSLVLGKMVGAGVLGALT